MLKRGANQPCAFGASTRTFLMQVSIKPAGIVLALSGVETPASLQITEICDANFRDKTLVE